MSEKRECQVMGCQRLGTARYWIEASSGEMRTEEIAICHPCAEQLATPRVQFRLKP